MSWKDVLKYLDSDEVNEIRYELDDLLLDLQGKAVGHSPTELPLLSDSEKEKKLEEFSEKLAEAKKRGLNRDAAFNYHVKAKMILLGEDV